jgi:hypothetical protein
VSPIFVRPVREQLEHDRLIRHLQLKYKRKFDVATNLGEEQLAPVKIGALTLFPDLVLTSGKKLAGVIEVESGESVNNLEAMAQWVHFSRSRVPFHLYVPVQSYEAAKRLCDANHAHPAEIWTYRASMDGFDLVRMANDTAVRPPRPRPVAAAPVARPVKPAAAKPARPKPARPSKPTPKAKPRKASSPSGRKPAGALKKPAARAKSKAAGARRR